MYSHILSFSPQILDMQIIVDPITFALRAFFNHLVVTKNVFEFAGRIYSSTEVSIYAEYEAKFRVLPLSFTRRRRYS